MNLTQQEVEQLTTAGFSAEHIEQLGAAKVTAVQSGVDWAGVFDFAIKNGPAIFNSVKTLAGLFGFKFPTT